MIFRSTEAEGEGGETLHCLMTLVHVFKPYQKDATTSLRSPGNMMRWLFYVFHFQLVQLNVLHFQEQSIGITRRQFTKHLICSCK